MNAVSVSMIRSREAYMRLIEIDQGINEREAAVAGKEDRDDEGRVGYSQAEVEADDLQHRRDQYEQDEEEEAVARSQYGPAARDGTYSTLKTAVCVEMILTLQGNVSNLRKKEVTAQALAKDQGLTCQDARLASPEKAEQPSNRQVRLPICPASHTALHKVPGHILLGPRPSPEAVRFLVALAAAAIALFRAEVGAVLFRRFAVVPDGLNDVADPEDEDGEALQEDEVADPGRFSPELLEDVEVQASLDVIRLDAAVVTADDDTHDASNDHHGTDDVQASDLGLDED
jgi:hypothetical protein